MKSWLKTLKTLRPCSSAMATGGSHERKGGGGGGGGGGKTGRKAGEFVDNRKGDKTREGEEVKKKAQAKN